MCHDHNGAGVGGVLMITMHAIGGKGRRSYRGDYCAQMDRTRSFALVFRVNPPDMSMVPCPRSRRKLWRGETGAASSICCMLSGTPYLQALVLTMHVHCMFRQIGHSCDQGFQAWFGSVGVGYRAVSRVARIPGVLSVLSTSGYSGCQLQNMLRIPGLPRYRNRNS